MSRSRHVSPRANATYVELVRASHRHPGTAKVDAIVGSSSRRALLSQNASRTALHPDTLGDVDGIVVGHHGVQLQLVVRELVALPERRKLTLMMSMVGRTIIVVVDQDAAAATAVAVAKRRGGTVDQGPVSSGVLIQGPDVLGRWVDVVHRTGRAASLGELRDGLVGLIVLELMPSRRLRDGVHRGVLLERHCEREGVCVCVCLYVRC